MFMNISECYITIVLRGFVPFPTCFLMLFGANINYSKVFSDKNRASNCIKKGKT